MPIRESEPIPSITSRTSAPTPSQIAATALINEIFVAKNAFAAYFIVSAEEGSVIIVLTASDSYNSQTSFEALTLCDPMTILSGCRKSWIALPSRRNSGFDTTLTSDLPRVSSITAAEPTGTVDFVTTVASALKKGPISFETLSIKDVSAVPSSPCGVGKHKKMKSASETARSLLDVKNNLFDSTPIKSRSKRPSSTIGHIPLVSWSNFV